MMPRLRFILLFATILFPGVARGAEREAWTTSKFHGSPEPPRPFRVERAFPNVTFKNPVDVVNIPGTKRMVIVEQAARLVTIENENATSADPFADLREFDREAVESYSVTFHPDFKSNRFVFVWMILDGKGKPNREDGTRLVRFKMTDANPPQLDMKSGQVIFSWLSGGHNGGNLRFGPDRMLYFCAGDAEVPDPPDPRNTGQDISDVLASVLRIDVDHLDAGRNYGIPKDNPFVNTPGARGEVWAYGFRNPWRLSFDSRKGDLWVGDVGWELWEMIHRVEKGGNYGWSITEAGKQEVRPNGQRGPTPILPPTVVHSHDEAASISGGEVYYGSKLPPLNGAYVYGDWQFGTFWSFKFENGRVVQHQELCRSSLMPIAFGADPNGELLICDHGAGGLWRFARNPDSGKPANFPKKLSDSGLFADVPTQKPAAGVLPYEVSAHRWADHATSERWVGLPGDSKITVAKEGWGVVGAGRLSFPEDTVLALTYSMEMERGKPSTKRKIETQVMHYDGIGWGAYSYRWNEGGTDAELVGPKGEETTLEVKDGGAPGGTRRQNWKFFARSECLRCHTIWNNFTPGFTGAQLDTNILKTLAIKPEPKRLVDPYHGPASLGDLEQRARSYLHVNCSVCHREAGGGAVRTYMNFDRPLKDTRMINEKPVLGGLGLDEARVIFPGAPERSVLLYRMATAGRGHMPYLGGKLIDDAGILVMRDWIDSLATQKIRKAPPTLETPTGALQLALAVIDRSLTGNQREDTIKNGAALADPLKRDLFERFLPPEQRRKILGPNFDTAKLLAAKGNATQGKEIFTAICATCHRADGTGADFGPDLTKITAKYNTRAALLEQITHPGKVIDPEWNVTTVTLPDADSVSGFVVTRNDSGLTLKLPGGERRQIAAKEIQNLTTARASLMPEGLLDNLSAEEAADLLEFLSTRHP